MDAEKQNKQFQKMTTEPVGKLLASLSVPTILTMLISNFYNIVDTAFVGTLGTSQSAATGIVFGFMGILQAAAFMCGQGSGSIMSRKLGAKDLEEATRYASTGFFLSFSLAAVIGVLSLVFMDPLMRVLGSTDTIMPYARTYVLYIIFSAPFFCSSLTLNNLLRYEGRAKLGTIGLMIGSVLNIAGDAFLMFVLKMGIAGAGLSTAVSQIISFGILLSMFLRGKTQTRISIRHVSTEMSVIGNIVTTGFPSLLRQSLNSVATMLLNQSAGLHGDEAVAAMSIVSRISYFPMAVALGIGQGFQPISSFNFGAKKKDRVRRAFFLALIGAECALTLMLIPVFIQSPALVRMLRDDEGVVEIGTRALRLMCVTLPFVPPTMMVEMGFQSIGEKMLAAFGSCLRSGVIFIPTLLLFTRIRGLAGVQEAQPAAYVISFFICLYLMRIYLRILKE